MALGRARAETLSLRRSADALGQQVLDTGLVTRAEVDARWRTGVALQLRVAGDLCAPLSNTPAASSAAAAAPQPPSQPWTNQDDYRRLPR